MTDTLPPYVSGDHGHGIKIGFSYWFAVRILLPFLAMKYIPSSGARLLFWVS